MFTDRKEAGQALASRLEHFKDQQGVVVGVPRGGIPIGYEIAQALGWPLEIALSKKIGHPTNKEYAIGAVSLNGYVVNRDIAVPQEYLETEIARIRQALETTYHTYLQDQNPLPLSGKTVILTDDGVATGHTLLSVIDLLRRTKPARLVVAVPVSAPEALKKIEAVADETLCLASPREFRSVGQFYQAFDQVADQEVAALLHKRRNFRPR
ncbi:phosphoribosyltransferase [Cesiribacter andamanensis]|uniref:Orotate phosphoribosyltransferase-like protein n=1 Tax=Cesiribacter andamanensis AMV16 TaxID=1279009 RepID=M7N5B7_9BACT|nr:phosphoribosyltransferase family protein [Cesiribacter andamanensis]EMR03803.1 orotate phosphoribosyltransferase-like protein [Cesiribacter andamanensis AMV16]